MPFLVTGRDCRALLVGVSEYDDDGHPGIPAAKRALSSLHELFTRKRGLNLPASVVTVSDSPDGQDLFDDARQAAAEAGKLLLFYFCGHGYLHQEPSRPPQLYLLPSNAPHARPWQNGVRYEDLLHVLASGRAERLVVILDCCYSGNAKHVPAPEGKGYTLITSSREQARHSQGDGDGPPPFTRALLDVLSAGTDPGEPVTVGSLYAPLRRRAEADRDRAQNSKDTSHPGDWWPAVSTYNCESDTVLSLARAPARRRGERPAPPPEPPPSFPPDWPDIRDWLRAQAKGPLWRRLLGAALSLVLVAVAAGVTAAGLVTAAGSLVPPPGCGQPLQLRVLTAPEYEQALGEVIERFEVSAAAREPLGGQPAGCQQIDAFVYSAPTGTVVDAFAATAAWSEPERACPDPGERRECARPLRDVGPRPDVWIPASGMPVEPVADSTRRAESTAYLGTGTRLALSPAVLAVPGTLPGVERTGETLEALLAAAGEAGLTVSSADPASSDAALAHGFAAPGAIGDGGIAPPDDRELLCSLPGPGEEAPPALLIGERTVVDLIAEEAPACLPHGTAHRAADPSQGRYTAYYPADVAPLDLTFVPVHWEDAWQDAGERTEATNRLREWLTGKEGSYALAGAGFRVGGWEPGEAVPAVSAQNRVPLNDGAFVTSRVPAGDPPDSGDTAAYLGDREESRSPRDVVFVLDVSTGFYTEARQEEITGVLEAGTGALSPGTDRFGLLTAPAAQGSGTAWQQRLGDASPAAVADVLGGLAAVDADAPVTEALTEAADALAGSASAGRAPLLVLVTDGEDSPAGGAPSLGVPVAVVALGEPGCGEAFHRELAAGDDSLCIDGTTRDPATRLHDAVAGLTGENGS